MQKFPNLFFGSVGMILGITGVAKMWSALSSAKILAVADPIFNLQFRRLLFIVGILELIVVGICIFNKSQLRAIIIAGFATDLLIYRFGLLLMGWRGLCPCLGNLTDAIHISPQIADNIMKAVLAYLLIGSYGIFFYQWWRRRKLKVESPSSALANKVEG